MKFLFLNANNRHSGESLKKYLGDLNLDVVIFAEANGLKKLPIDDFAFKFASPYKYGLLILSKIAFSAESLDYAIDDSRIKVKVENQKDRILVLSFANGVNALVTHVDYGFYNPFAMNLIGDYAKKNHPNLIIGDFNSGYIEDNLDIENGGIAFQNGYLYFSKFESYGYINNGRGRGDFSYISPKSKRKFRLDHCFSYKREIKVDYLDFISNKISDHNAMVFEI